MDVSEDRFMAVVEALRRAAPILSPLAAGIVAAVHLGIASDSRSFSKRLGVPHALTLREITLLSQDHHLIDILRRDSRTSRVHFDLSVQGEALASRVAALP